MRKPFVGKYVSPFSFLRLFRTTPMLTQLTLFNVFLLVTEGKCIMPLHQLWMKGNLTKAPVPMKFL